MRNVFAHDFMERNVGIKMLKVGGGLDWSGHGGLEGEFKFRNHLSKAAVVRFFCFGRVREGECFPRSVGEMVKQRSHDGVNGTVGGKAEAEVFKILRGDVETNFLLLGLLGFIWGLRF